MASAGFLWLFSIDILSKFDIDAKQPFNYEKFQTLCVQLFSADEVKENEWRVQEIFKLFDANADSVLVNEELFRCCKWIHMIMNPINILLVIDVQNDFVVGTFQKYGFKHGLEVVEPINRILKEGHWDDVIYVQDWHPENHISFFDNLAMRELDPKSEVTKETAKLFDTVVFLQPHLTQILLPKHCVQNTWGAELYNGLLILPSSKRLHKGQNPEKDIYSAFEKDEQSSIKLEKLLSAVERTFLYVCGLTYDLCVKETCLDGLQLGYPVAVIEDCCRSIKPNEKTTESYIENGALVAHSNRVLSLVNEQKHSLVMAHQAAKTANKH
ncbi:Pyrazinamidase/nicotinamidase [Atta colombica]|uniref:nicotinamidase n=1 Tax=Atta colombica TaxID=520822 RepID=A0A195B5Q3_9HYME|nr:PREDICTED: pyrazinamidase/nicotinamidase-like [Atta colombica]KYM79848.1 Pyrazinamidase/nicotinamidase [Atta colombica]